MGRQDRPGTLADEPSRELVREILDPEQLLADLDWRGSAGELALPIPCDHRSVIDPEAPCRLVIEGGRQAEPLRATLCTILDRAGSPAAVTVTMPADPPAAMAGLREALRHALPGLVVQTGAAPAPAGGPEVRAPLRMAAGDELPWGWPDPPPESAPPPPVAFLLAGVPPEGSGGVNSVVQEARGLRALGARSWICVPAAATAHAHRLYGNGDELFVFSDEGALPTTATADVVVATEHTTVPLLAAVARERPDVACAYYVQDYEPLFALPGSPRADRALLSYRALPDATLFAKTHFIRNVVGARHGVSVAKVPPSLDRALFHAGGRDEDPGRPLRITAMVRPRTPRRRPRATLASLERIAAALGDAVEVITFGCDAGELPPAGPGVRHHGRLDSAEVARLLRRCDVFIDGSAYQAFGRSGLEAMACGAVPVLPSLGGVREYAVDDGNAIVLDDDRPESVAGAVIALAADRERLERLRAAALRTGEAFSVERAALAQVEMFRFLTLRASRRRAPG